MIRQLPDHLVNQIAAGEVVERPASVIKELVENAIDAKANRIEVRLDDAGKSLIEVRDNGAGIAPEQLPLAVQRHATSKLPDQNLNAITTRGFRGEALPSIASVCEFRLTSRTAEQDSAWTINNDGGQFHPPKPDAGATGTTVRVANLFRTTPARLKFLRSDSAERRAIKSALISLALSAPNVAITLIENGKTLLDLPIDHKTRLARLLGNDFLNAHVDHSHQRGDIHVRVLAGLPTLNRATSSDLYFLVNDRPVDDRRLTGVVRAAYRDFVPKGRFPTLLASISIPAHLVDVNVHPAKTEVRFRDPSEISSALMGTLRNALDRGPSQSSGHLSQSLSQSLGGKATPSASAPFKIPPRPAASQVRLALGGQAPLTAPPPRRPQDTGFHEATTQDSFATPADLPPIPNSDQPLGTPLALLHKTYILSQTIDGFCLIDMHAAHERLVYEDLKSQYGLGTVPRQALLVPHVVPLTKDQVEILMTAQENLDALGLSLETFGEDTILVREVPALLAEKANWTQMIQDLAEVLTTEDLANPLETRLHERLATLACYGSVRSGRSLNIAEMDALLRKMEANPRSAQCNHGRPTSVTMGLNQLASLFERS